MFKSYSHRFIASLAITALTVTAGLTPSAAMASEGNNIKLTYSVQSTKSYINTITRLGGLDRYETTSQIADFGWQSAGIAVLVPSGDQNMADALASSSLAKVVDGPILLTDQDSVPISTLNQLKRLGVTKVYIVSGMESISGKVENDLLSAGIQYIRLGGNDRYVTAVNVAKEIQKIKPFQEVVVTNGYAYVDAISISPIAAAKGIPILLVEQDSVPKVVSDFIQESGINKSYVIGGTGVVSDFVKDSLPKAERLGGGDRYATNTEVLKKFENLVNGATIFFANGSDSHLIDSLTGAPMVAEFGGLIVLSNNETVPDDTQKFIRENILLKNPVILGGTGVITDSAIQSLGYVQPNVSDAFDGAIELNTPNITIKDKTVNGNLYVNESGETLKNVIINGTLFIDPGKDGSTTLDGVKAKKIVILSGADHSIYLKETQADNLVVSSSSKVHVVAGQGTTIGSTLVQSSASIESQDGANIGLMNAQPRLATPIEVQLQGIFQNEVNLSGSVKLTATTDSVISKVKVSGASTPDSIQLAGNFLSVSIADNSSITLLTGKIDELDTKGTSSIVVKSGAEVVNLSTITGSILVSGGGTVNGRVTASTPTEVVTVPADSSEGGTSNSTSGDSETSDDQDGEVINQTAQPVISGTVRVKDTTISGTAEAGATVSIKKGETVIGTGTVDENGAFTLTIDSDISLALNDELFATAIVPRKSISNTVSITVQPAFTNSPSVIGEIGAGDTLIMGTTEAGAIVSVKRAGVEIGTTTARTSNGNFMVSLDSEVTLAENDILEITAIAPDKVESNALTVTVTAKSAPTMPPEINKPVRDGDTTISGKAEAGACICVLKNETMICLATANETGLFTVNLDSEETFTEGDILSIMAKAPDKAISESVSITVEPSLNPTPQPTETKTVKAF